MRIAFFTRLMQRTAQAWLECNPFREAAAIAFYAVFSLAPVLIIAVAIGSLFVDKQSNELRADLAEELTQVVGAEGGRAIRQILEAAGRSPNTPGALVFSGLTLLLGAIMIFLQLQTSLNEIWGVERRTGRGLLIQLVLARVKSFVVAMTVVALMMLSLVLTAALQIAQRYLDKIAPSNIGIWQALNTALWVMILAVLFAVIYRVMPDVRVRWRHVSVGGVVTALLFSVGKAGIAIYLSWASLGSSYGGAGSLVVLLIWVYYSAMIWLFGAHFTHQYARIMHERVKAKQFAEAAPGHEDEVSPSEEATPSD